MKIFFSFTILFFLFLGINPVLGQETYNLPPNSDYEKAVIGLKNFRKKNVEELHIENDSIYFQQESKQFAMHLDEINYIRVHEGSRAKNGAIIGGATMLIISLGAILQVQSDPNYVLRDDAGARVALYTGGGILLGALIGSGTRQYTSYYVHISKN